MRVPADVQACVWVRENIRTWVFVRVCACVCVCRHIRPSSKFKHRQGRENARGQVESPQKWGTVGNGGGGLCQAGSHARPKGTGAALRSPAAACWDGRPG